MAMDLAAILRHEVFCECLPKTHGVGLRPESTTCGGGCRQTTVEAFAFFFMVTCFVPHVVVSALALGQRHQGTACHQGRPNPFARQWAAVQRPSLSESDSCLLRDHTKYGAGPTSSNWHCPLTGSGPCQFREFRPVMFWLSVIYLRLGTLLGMRGDPTPADMNHSLHTGVVVTRL